MKIEMFFPMIPPTVTHQEKAVKIVNNKPVFYEPQELKNARAKLSSHLSAKRPLNPIHGPIRLITRWCFPIKGKHYNGEYKTSRPDTDNLQKLLKDVMTATGYWRDDAQVASEVIEKFWAEIPGIYITIETIEQNKEG